jgi:endoglycosylceramidase
MWSHNRSLEANRHGTPLWVGEIGSSEQVDGFFHYIEEAMNTLDYMGAGWMWWSNDPSKTWGLIDREKKENEKLRYLVRTYPRAVAGHPLGYSFDVDSGDFQLKFQTLDGLNGKTEIFVPRRHYPKGYDIKVYNKMGGTKWSHTYNDSSQILYLSTENSGAPYTVLIKRKN